MTQVTDDSTTAAELLQALGGLRRPRVLVLGDLILDRYTWGNAERVSQEAPVILLRADRREARPGGAANVANMLRGLEAHVTCAGVLAHDGDGDLLSRLLRQAGADLAGVFPDDSRPTTVKERFIGRAQGRHPHQMLRVDTEVRDPLAPHLQRRLADWIAAHLAEFDVLLVSDYDKGVCTPALLRHVLDAARRQGIPSLVDPVRSADYTRYRGATSMTPNRLEAGMAAGITIDTPENAFEAGRRLCRGLGLDFAVVTLDRDGMALVEASGEGRLFPTSPRSVYDITGAGDMALATIGMCLAAGLPPATSVQLANVAAGLEVEKIGVAIVSREEIRSRLAEQLALRAAPGPAAPSRRPVRSVAEKRLAPGDLGALGERLRQEGRKIVFTNGCFDLLHAGHAGYLAEARLLGDVLVVGLNSDESVRRLKGPARPIIGQGDRAALLAALECVDFVVVFSSDTPWDLVCALRPDVLVKGGNYAAGEIVGRDVVESYGGKVCVTGFVEGLSTTAILNRAAELGPRVGPQVERRKAQEAA